MLLTFKVILDMPTLHCTLHKPALGLIEDVPTTVGEISCRLGSLYPLCHQTLKHGHEALF